MRKITTLRRHKARTIFPSRGNKKSLYKDGMYTSLSLERAFVRIVIEQLAEAGVSHREFALRTFTSVAEGSRAKTWERVRGANEKEKPRELSLDECEAIARSLGKDLEYLLFMARKIMRSGGE